MSRRTTAIHIRHTPIMVVWTALALAFALAFLAWRPGLARASNGGGITLEPSPDGVYAIGSYLTATFSTDGALYANTPLSVSFVSSTSGAVNYSKYTIVSAAGTTYTVSISVPNLSPGEYILVIEGQEINGGKLTSNPIIIAAPTPTPLPQPALVPIGTQAHVVLPGPPVSGGVVAAAAAGLLLAVSLALLIVPPLRRRGNQPPR